MGHKTNWMSAETHVYNMKTLNEGWIQDTVAMNADDSENAVCARLRTAER